MSIVASFSGFKCPECGNMIMASEVKGTHEPSLAVTICEWCDAELQVTTDHVSGRVAVEKLKKS